MFTQFVALQWEPTLFQTLAPMAVCFHCRITIINKQETIALTVYCNSMLLFDSELFGSYVIRPDATQERIIISILQI